MYKAIDRRTLEHKLRNNSLTPLRGIEEEDTGKSYIWVRDWKGKTNIAIANSDPIQEGYRFGLEKSVSDKDIFGSYAAADQFYERVFGKLLPSEKLDKLGEFVERIGQVYSEFSSAKESLRSKIPKRFAYYAIDSIFRFHMLELAVIAGGAYWFADKLEGVDYENAMRLVRFAVWVAGLSMVLIGTSKAAIEYFSEKQFLRDATQRNIQTDPILNEFIVPLQITNDQE